MKTYSIGRDLNCDIVINDSTDVISRRHALLNVTPSGKMTLVDQSSNGTYVNGIRISPNVPVPVTRKDIISLAHVGKLDWGQIPKSNQWVKFVVGAIIAVIVILAVIFGMKAINVDSNDSASSTAEEVDSNAPQSSAPADKAEKDDSNNPQATAPSEESKKDGSKGDQASSTTEDKAKDKTNQKTEKAKTGTTKKKASKPKGEDKEKDTKEKDKQGKKRIFG